MPLPLLSEWGTNADPLGAAVAAASSPLPALAPPCALELAALPIALSSLTATLSCLGLGSIAANPLSGAPPPPPAPSLSFFLAGPSSSSPVAPAPPAAFEAPGMGKSRTIRSGPLPFLPAFDGAAAGAGLTGAAVDVVAAGAGSDMADLGGGRLRKDDEEEVGAAVG